MNGVELTLGIEIPIAAVAMGATCIEKHFTLDKCMEGPDHRASLDPPELGSMVSAIRGIELALGDGIKRPSPSEEKNRMVARKSIHLARELPAGHELAVADLCMKRPGDGISPMDVAAVLGKKLKREMLGDSKLRADDFD